MDYFKRFLARPVSIVRLTLVSLVLIYLIMLWDTNSIFNYAKAVFRGEIQRELVENTPWNRYDKTHTKDGVSAVEMGIKRVFVIHNFFDGYMWIEYYYMGYDENGEMIFLSTQEFPYLAKWKIHKEHGKWVLVDIEEHP